jgi:hypothetical protein
MATPALDEIGLGGDGVAAALRVAQTRTPGSGWVSVQPLACLTW